MKISRLIFLSFLLILVLFSFTTYINVKLLEKVHYNADFISKSAAVVRITGRFQRNILTMVSGLRGYLITGETYFVDNYDAASAENEEILRELAVLIPDTSIQQTRIKEILKLNNDWVVGFAEPLKQAKQMSIVNDSNLVYFNRLYRDKVLTGDEAKLQKELQDKFRDFSNYEYAERDKQRGLLEHSMTRTRSISFILTGFSILMSLVIVVYVTRTISERINGMVQIADNIASGNYKVQLRDNNKDELSRLSSSLNHMAGVLSESIGILQRKNAELDQFAHIVSHDLKGPLRGIDNVVTWIEEDHSTEISPKLSDYLQLIKGRVVRTENLIQGILDYARTEKETNKIEYVDTFLLVNEIVDSMITKRSINFLIERNLPAFYTERIPLLQVLSNLISNAVKYHDKIDGKVRIYHKEHPDYYEFFVADNGPGIAPVYHEKIFLIFQTLRDKDSFESTGVGLAIVKKILDNRKEKIHLESEPGSGSVFSFTWKKTQHGTDS